MGLGNVKTGWYFNMNRFKNFFQSLPSRIAIWLLSRQLRKHTDYAWTWQCNLAMMAYDAGASHEKANRMASSFLLMLFGVDVRDSNYWKDFEKKWKENERN